MALAYPNYNDKKIAHPLSRPKARIKGFTHLFWLLTNHRLDQASKNYIILTY
jgi:hypothetical protein